MFWPQSGPRPQAFWPRLTFLNARWFSLLLENDLRRALAEESKAAVRPPYDRTHRLANRVERVDFVDLVFRQLVAHCLVVLTEVEHEPEQRTLGLVTDLFRQVSLVVCRLQTHWSVYVPQRTTSDIPH